MIGYFYRDNRGLLGPLMFFFFHSPCEPEKHFAAVLDSGGKRRARTYDRSQWLWQNGEHLQSPVNVIAFT